MNVYREAGKDIRRGLARYDGTEPDQSDLPTPGRVLRPAPVAVWRIRHESGEVRKAVDVSVTTDDRTGDRVVTIKQDNVEIALPGAMRTQVFDAYRAALLWKDES